MSLREVPSSLTATWEQIPCRRKWSAWQSYRRPRSPLHRQLSQHLQPPQHHQLYRNRPLSKDIFRFLTELTPIGIKAVTAIHPSYLLTEALTGVLHRASRWRHDLHLLKLTRSTEEVHLSYSKRMRLTSWKYLVLSRGRITA